MRLRGLLAASDPSTRNRVGRLIARHEVEVLPVSGAEELRQRLTREDVDLALVHRPLLDGSAEAWIGMMRRLPNRPDVIILGNDEDAQDCAALLGAGSLAVLNLELPDPPLDRALDALIVRRREDLLRRFKVDRPDKRYRLEDFVLASPSMQRFIGMARRVMNSESPLLVVGETGVGKERLARAMHAEGPRADGPFIAVNCAALPENLLESELFGHEQGAFTGASRQRRGFFELAHRGTLFLDEIGDLPVHLQAKLLRVLEDRIVYRVGGERPIPVDVRLMAAANRDLEAAMQSGAFRPDLYYRLAVVTLTLPPLRERREDILPLVQHFLEYFRRHLGRPVTGVRPEVIEALQRYAWPGNVRELINVVERAVLICAGAEIGLDDLPRAITGRASDPAKGREPGCGAIAAAFDKASGAKRRPLVEARRDMVAAFEKAYLAQLLTETGGRIGETARVAGINARFLYDLMRRYGLRKEDFRKARRGADAESDDITRNAARMGHFDPIGNAGG